MLIGNKSYILGLVASLVLFGPICGLLFADGLQLSAITTISQETCRESELIVIGIISSKLDLKDSQLWKDPSLAKKLPLQIEVTKVIKGEKNLRELTLIVPAEEIAYGPLIGLAAIGS